MSSRRLRRRRRASWVFLGHLPCEDVSAISEQRLKIVVMPSGGTIGNQATHEIEQALLTLELFVLGTSSSWASSDSESSKALRFCGAMVSFGESSTGEEDRSVV